MSAAARKIPDVSTVRVQRNGRAYRAERALPYRKRGPY
jgi:hypothetical protein